MENLPKFISNIQDDTEDIMALITARSCQIVSDMKSRPFAMLDDICQYYCQLAQQPETHKWDLSRRIVSFVNSNNDSTNQHQCIRILTYSTNSIEKYTSFGMALKYQKCPQNKLILDHIKESINHIDYTLDSYIKHVVSDCIRHNNNFNVNVEVLASLLIEFLLHVYTEKEIAASMAAYGWHLNIIDEKKEYHTRSYREGPMETVTDTIRSWYLIHV